MGKPTMHRKLTTNQIAKHLGISHSRILHKIKQGHFPNQSRCECGRSILIPESDLALSPIDRRCKAVKR